MAVIILEHVHQSQRPPPQSPRQALPISPSPRRRCPRIQVAWLWMSMPATSTAIQLWPLSGFFHSAERSQDPVLSCVSFFLTFYCQILHCTNIPRFIDPLCQVVDIGLFLSFGYCCVDICVRASCGHACHPCSNWPKLGQ